MKKLILNLGLSTLAILPIVAIASCSSSSEIPSINTEVDKFKDPFTAKDESKSITPLAAVEIINGATEAEKIIALGKLISLPPMNNSFTYKVGVAKTGSSNNSIIVPLTITQTLTPTNTKTIDITITGLADSSLLEAEIVKFQTSLPANTASQAKETTTVIKEINDSANKEETLKTIVDNLPALSKGFTLTVGTASIDKTEVTSINVEISVTQDSSSTSKSTTLTITGLKESTELLNKEAAKFADPHQTTWKVEITEAIKTLNDQTNNEEKIKLLKQHVTEFPTLSPGFELTVGQAAEVSGSINSITVALTVTQTSNKMTKDVSLIILGFEEPPVEPTESL